MARPTMQIVLLLRRAEDWFRSAGDGEEGVHWQNGESTKYSGDAWRHAVTLHRNIRAALNALGDTEPERFYQKPKPRKRRQRTRSMR